MNPKYQYTGDLLTRTIEECAEVIHILCKIKRFGLHNHHPTDKNKTPNWKLAQSEISDLRKCLKDMNEACSLAKYKEQKECPRT